MKLNNFCKYFPVLLFVGVDFLVVVIVHFYWLIDWKSDLPYILSVLQKWKLKTQYTNME